MNPPQHILSNGLVTAHLYLPDPANGHYRGTRFDWSSLLYQVEYAGHTFFGPWNPQAGDPAGHDSNALGLASEFGMDSPLGYNDARPGETFVKIGVGLLQKQRDEPYAFHARYPIVQPGAWQVTPAGRDQITFRQTLDGGRGWAYDYEKQVRLGAPGRPVLTVAHRLRNTGAKTITTDHYCHHFSRVNNAPLGPDYQITFAFAAAARAPMNEGAQIANGRLRLAGPLAPGKTIFAHLDGLTGRPSDHGATVENTRVGAGYTLQGDRTPHHVNLWGMENCVCPEPFVALSIPPGQETRWQTEYTFFARSGGNAHTNG